MWKRIALLSLTLVAAVGLFLYWPLPGLRPPVTPVRPLVRMQPIEPSTSTPVAGRQDPLSHGHDPHADPEFREWLRSEARLLDHPSLNGPAKQKQLKSVVQQLTASQRSQLLETAMDLGAAAGEKILSVYLLVEAAALPELRELVNSPMQNKGPHPAHSGGEAVAMRERSLRAMALDGLLDQARRHPETINELKSFIETITDPTLRARADREYQALQNQ